MSNYISTGLSVKLTGNPGYTDIGNVFCDNEYNQTITGVKQFTNLPNTTSTNFTNPQQLVAKSYVDGLGAQNINYTGRQFNTTSAQAPANFVFSPNVMTTNLTQSFNTKNTSIINASNITVNVDSPANADQVLTFGVGGGGKTQGMWIACGRATNTLAYSYDGFNWTPIVNLLGTSLTGAGVEWNGNMWIVGAAGGGTIMEYSYDGIIWTGLTALNAECKGIVWNGIMWVAVGGLSNSGIMFSYNGINWFGVLALINIYFRCVDWNGIMWVAGGAGVSPYYIAYSYNGINWIPTGTGIITSNLYGLAWNGTMWVACGQSANTIVYSYNGVNWFGLGGTIFGLGFCVKWNGYMWVAGGQTTNSLAYSYDGFKWTGLGLSIFSSFCYCLGWNGTMWIAGGSGTINTMAYSYNGINWYGLGKTIFTTNMGGVKFAGARSNIICLPASRTLALGKGTNGTIAYAYAGTGNITYDLSTNWTYGITQYGYSTNTLFNQANAAAWNGTKWIAVGSTVGSLSFGNTLAYSSIQNGNVFFNALLGKTTGTNCIGNAGNIWIGLGNYVFSVEGNGIGWNGNVWVAAGQGVNSLAYSPDGFSWFGLGNNIFNVGNSVTWNGIYWLATGSGINTMAYSGDGVVWTGLGNTIFTVQAKSATWNGVLWVACGQGGNTLAVSSDIFNWYGLGTTTFSTSGNCVTFGTNNMWVSTGSGTNTLAYSSDGINWTPVGSIFTTAGNSVTWNGKFFVAAGQGTNTMAYSPNGINWTGETTSSPFSTTGIGMGTTANMGVGGVIIQPNYSLTTGPVQPLWVAAGAFGTNVLRTFNYSTLAYSYNGITWNGVQNSPFELQGNSVAYSPTQNLWVATGSATRLYNVISTTGLVFYYNFNLDSYSGSTIYNYATGAYSSVGAATMYDGSGNLATGLISSFAPNSGNGSLLLNNSRGLNAYQNYYVQMPAFVTPPAVVGNGMSFCVWINNNNIYNISQQYARVFDFGNGNPSDNIQIFIQANQAYTATTLNITLQLYQGTSLTGFFNNATTTVAENTFHHIVWTIAYLAGPVVTWLLYVDGVLIQSFTSSTGVTNIWPIYIQRNCYIGRPQQGSYDPYLNGMINEFRYYTRAISAAEVTTLFNTRTNTFANSNTLAYSSNGINWTGLGKSVFSDVAQYIVWNGTMWVASGAGTNTLGYSYNGTVWAGSGTSVFTTTGYGMAWNGFMWIATGTGTNTLAYSFNGVNWIGLGATIFTVSGLSVAWNGVLWVALGQGTNTVAYSYNGYNWIGLTTTVFSTAGYGAAWNGKLWVAVGTGTNSIAWSNEGITWTGLGITISAVGFITIGYSVSWNGQLWLASGSGTQGNIVYSPNGKLWYTTTNSIFTNVYGLGNNNFFTGNQIQLNSLGAAPSQTLDVVSNSYYNTGFSEIMVSVIPKPLSIFSGTPFILNGGSQVVNGSYLIATFATTGANTFIINRSGFINMLLIAGGGGGGSATVVSKCGGGGGAGGYILLNNYYINAGSYTVTVGSGGAPITNGGSTIFGTYTAVGGGYGGYSGLANGNTGGSGGGGYYLSSSTAAGTAGQGFSGAGGSNGTPLFTSGGGGGAFSVGGSLSGSMSGGCPLLLGPAILPGYNNVVAVCGGGGGGVQTTSNYTTSGGYGGIFNHNGTPFRSGGVGLYWNFNVTNFVPTSAVAGSGITYGSGGGGAAASTSVAVGTAGRGVAGACIITYSLANSSVFYNNPVINLDPSTGISASTWIDSASGINYTFYNSSGGVNSSGNSVILSNGQTVAYFNGSTYATSLVGVATYLYASYTHDIWICPLSVANSTILSETNTVSTYSVDYMALNGSGNIISGLWSGSWGTISSLAAATANTWYHVVSVFDRVTNLLTLYVNGVRQSTATYNRAIPTNGFSAIGMNTSYYIGRPGGNPGTNAYFNGYIGAVKLYGYPLTASQVASNYTTFLPRYQNVTAVPATSLPYTFRIIAATSWTGIGAVPTTDVTGTYTITNTGSVTAVADPTGIRGYVFQFSGANYLSVTATTPINSTRTFWLYSATPGAGGAGYGNVFSTLLSPAYFNGTTQLTSGIVSSPYVQTTNWIFYAITFTSTTVSMYVNGTLVSTGANSWSGDTNPTLFGAYNTGTNYYTGYMDDMRLYPNTLTSAQISAIYNGQNVIGQDTLNNAYTFRVKAASTTVPTTDITGVYQLFNTTSSNGGPVVVVADPLGIRGYVFQFSGSNYLSIFAKTPPTSTRTFWLYTTSPGANANVFSSTSCTAYFLGTLFLITSSGTSTIAQTSNWTFYAITITSTHATTYVNGNVASTATNSWGGDTSAIQFGANAGTNFYTGYIDDMRMYPYVLTTSQITAIYNGQ